MPRARGPKVPVSAAALSDALGDACEIVSTWRDDLLVSDAACGTAPVEARNARLQSYETRAAGTQTTDPASARASDARASEDENLARFVRAVTPSMEEALRENAASETFAEDFYESALGGDDDDPFDAAGAECVHTLRPRPTPTDGAEDADDADAKFWRRLKPTGVSWNCNGYSLAVSYGRFDVTGWCDTPGAVCVWNLRRADVRADRPDFTIEHDVAIQCVAFHPTRPATLACGSFDGDVSVHDLSAEDGPRCIARSGGNSDAMHREPVTAVSWRFNLAEASKTSEKDRAYDVVTAGTDGRVFAWNVGRMETPAYGYELRAANARSQGRVVTWGVSCVDFGGGETHDPGAFLAGGDGGGVFRCATHDTPASRAEFHASVAGGALPNLRSPIKHEHDAHAGAVHGVRRCPRDGKLFATAGADGALRVYARRASSPLLTLRPSKGALFGLDWSPHRPLLLAVGTSDGDVVLYDLSRCGAGDASQPLTSFRATEPSDGGAARGGGGVGATQALAFNPALPEYLASADGDGVRVWELGVGLRSERAGERKALGRLAASDTSADAARALRRR